MAQHTQARANFSGLLDRLREEHERLLSENAQLQSKLEAEAPENFKIFPESQERRVPCPAMRSSERAEEAGVDFATHESMRSKMSKVTHPDSCHEGGVDIFESIEPFGRNVSPLSNGSTIVDLDSHLNVRDNSSTAVDAQSASDEDDDDTGKKVTGRPFYSMRVSWNDRAELLQEKLMIRECEPSSIFPDGTTSIVGHHVASLKARRNRRCKLCMIHPGSKVRVAWGLAGAFLLTYDLAIVPMDVCFELYHGVFLSTMVLIARIFWTLDIPLSFLTGVVREGTLLMHPKDVAHVYIRSWFAFDISLVSTEWFTMWIASSGSNSSPASLFRLVRFSRMVRLLRVLRLAKISKMKPYLSNVVLLSSPGLDSVAACVKVTIALVVLVHVGACVWHLIGDSLHDGWVEISGLKDASDARKYVMALRWILLHTQADSTGVRITTALEYVVDSIVIFCGFFFCAGYIGVVTNMQISLASSNVSRVHAMARRYTLRHKLRFETIHRLDQCLAVNQFGGPAEVLTEEQTLMEAIPQRLQMDLLFEVRLGMTQKMDFFVDQYVRTPRVLRSLTHRMVTMTAVAHEPWFAIGDVSIHMLFITQGRFCYECDERLLSTTPRAELRPRIVNNQSGTDLLIRGSVLSEPALWTTWEHLGNFWSLEDSILVAIDKDSFAQEILAHHRATVHAVKYARHFCWRLNRVAACDVTGFDLDLAALDTDLFIGGRFDHFAFVSHYKLEAGTEATLIKDEMEQKIKKDPSNSANDFMAPIFVDSENLVDLSTLSDHVRGSLALILLLTPGVLSRPWCLLEIVTAQKCGRPYVPVQLTRPGVSYVFPDEDFYARLHKDEIIAGGAQGRKILEENGTNLEEVERAIRSIFKMIALPYSPHKSAAVRAAEMSDILNRCMTVAEKSLRVLGRKNSTFGSADFEPLRISTRRS